MTDTYPILRLQPGEDRRIRAGHPWVFANELKLDDAGRALPAGSVVRLAGADGRMLGVGTFNRHSLIAVRLFSAEPDARLDRDFLVRRLTAARDLRARLGLGTHHRLVHAEGDALPGFIVDRYGDVAVVQANTAGAEALTPDLLDALDAVIAPRAIVLRNDAAVRGLEGLGQAVTLARGTLPDRIAAEEGGLQFPVDPLGGQKTGFFFDLRTARAQVAGLAAGAGRMLDVYCHTGAFGLSAAAAGAAEVTMVDRSDHAVALAESGAKTNGLAGRCRFVREDGFAALERLGHEGQRFDVVVTDPPSFVKSKKELKSGARGYRKLVRLAAPLVAPGGFYFVASCSHNVSAELFADEVRAGLAAAGRNGRVILAGGAGPDHPVHPHLPESAYIKYQVLQLD